MKSVEYDFPVVGCYVDESAGSADDCNRRTIEFAEAYGFDAGKISGCFDGLRGLEIEMTLDQVESCAHQGECIEDVEGVAEDPEIKAQFDKIGDDKIREAIKESGGWGAEELQNTEANRNRALWVAAGDARENLSEWLSETGDKAVEFLNGLETRSFMYWGFDDNSLFLMANVEGAREDVGFVTGQDGKDEPDADYRGEWLAVNDHGNATLYVRQEDGSDKEIWGVV